jgi:hypothetical protein
MNYKKLIISILLIGFLGMISTFLIFCPECLFSWPSAWRSTLASAIYWIVLWKGNEFVSKRLSRYFPWLENPNKRFAYGMIGSIVYTTSAIMILTFLMEWGLGWDMGPNKKATLLFANGVGILIFCFLVARQFMYAWRESALREEKIRSELMVSKFETLKSQINPHFMFNSLTALTSLVYDDQDLAVKYINQLSKVFRYVLEAGKKELVTLSEEFEMLKAYIFLQNIRFGKNFTVEEVIDPDKYDLMVPPLAIQMLLENAIKHNEISNDYPLLVSIKTEQGYLVISNVIRLKGSVKQNSTNLGLGNIKSRYEALSDFPVEIINDGTLFEVKLPLITYKP